MKRWICLLFCLALCLALTAASAGCGDGGASGKVGKGAAGVSDVLERGAAEAEGKAPGVSAGQPGMPGAASEAGAKPAEGPSYAPEEIDVDLTVLSPTMVYSEVYDMMTSPGDYVGKTVKMDGLFAYYHDEAADAYYFACFIQDATACCAQGIEFVLAGDHVFPDDYPEPGDGIRVIGVFDTYREGNDLYCTLRDAVFA